MSSLRHMAEACLIRNSVQEACLLLAIVRHTYTLSG